jgi:hypothetical protein
MQKVWYMFIASLTLLLITGTYVLTAHAEEKKVEAPKELVLAKKKDHSKDKKVDATKSPSQGSKAETTKK